MFEIRVHYNWRFTKSSLQVGKQNIHIQLQSEQLFIEGVLFSGEELFAIRLIKFLQ